jgi:hypothetical protein
MTVKEIGIILHGATGRIGATQHLANALAPIRAEGGLPSGTSRIMPRLLLVGRSATRLAEVAHRYDVTDWTQNLDEALARPDFPVFFDAAATEQRNTLSRLGQNVHEINIFHFFRSVDPPAQHHLFGEGCPHTARYMAVGSRPGRA